MATQERWTLETSRSTVPAKVRDVVHHRGHVFPSELTGTFTRHGRRPLVAILTVRMDEKQGPIPVRMVIESESLHSRDLRELPVPEMTKWLANRLAMTVEKPNPGVIQLKPVDKVIEWGPLHGHRAKTLEEVAEAWYEAQTDAKPPDQRVDEYMATKLVLSESRINSLIAEAREKRLIPKRGE